ncbi:MAG TPA: alpha/beta fold hydrolase [Moraxellaceae bacterium]|nr:alpha/beta fold hydrolase [Moraxellaceae bacterium]
MSVTGELPVTLPGPAGPIEARFHPGSGDGRVAVVCHPHPLHGGSMDNKVVTTLCRAWRDEGLAVVRFNFRGVGGSAGIHADGVGEVDDLLAVLRWLVEGQGARHLLLGGFSFGAWVAAAAAGRLPDGLVLDHLVLIAPPVRYAGFDALQPPAATVVVQGSADDVVDPASVVAWVASRQAPPVMVWLEGAGHFFHGRLASLKAELAARLFPGQ